jgi:PIN domain nuclease of toxin-antitoxin system
VKLLLDTHTFIWWYNEPDHLSNSALAAISDAENEILMSSASIWEIQIKLQANKLRFDIPLRKIIDDHCSVNEMQLLPITAEHVFILGTLQAHHKDPFDRILIAQAMVEKASLVTRDPLIGKYSVKVVW